MMGSEGKASSNLSRAWWETQSRRIIISVVGMFVLFMLMFWLAMKSRRMVAAALVVDEQHLAFGEVWEDPAFVWTLPIRNTTNENVEIAGFETSCSCGRIEPSSLTIPGQGIAEVRLTLNLLSAHREPDLVAKDFKVTVRPRITKRAGSHTGWIVQGKVKQPFAIDPPVVDFEESLVRGQPFAPRSVNITCGLDVAELTAHCDSSVITPKVTHEETDPRRFRLEVQAGKDLPGGFFNHLVRLTAVTPNKQKVSGAVPVMGRVLEDINLVPEVLAFGAEPIGSKLHETVVLRSHRGEDFAIQEIDTGGVSGISVEVGQKKDGRQSLAVSLVVGWLGHREHTVHVKLKTRQGLLLDLSLPLICHGIPAQKEDER